MIFRIASFIVLILSTVFAPWPVTAGLAVLSAALFPWFWEMVVVGLLLGVLYGFPAGGSGFLFAFFVSSFSVSLLAEEYLKKFISERSIISSVFITIAGGIVIALLWIILQTTLYAP